MNIKNLYVTAVVGIALLSGWNVSRIMSEKASLSDMALANAEALADESNNNEGYATYKTITTYYYNSSNQLDRTETYTVPCCAQGYYTCSHSSCE
jgi:hypothetical protein